MWKELLLLVFAVCFFVLSALAVYMGVGTGRRLRLVAATFLLIGSLVMAFAPAGLNLWLAVSASSLTAALGCAIVLLVRSLRKKPQNQGKREAVLPAYMVHPSVIERNELARILVQKGLFNVDDPNNVLFLPSDVELSRKTKVALHAHICEPLVKKQIQVLDDASKRDRNGRTLIEGVRIGDPTALQEAKKILDDLRDFTAMNIVQGKLKINANDPN